MIETTIANNELRKAGTARTVTLHITVYEPLAGRKDEVVANVIWDMLTNGSTFHRDDIVGITTPSEEAT